MTPTGAARSITSSVKSTITIVPLTPVGEVTARILGFNHVDRLLERQELQKLGRYPTTEALAIIDGQ